MPCVKHVFFILQIIDRAIRYIFILYLLYAIENVCADKNGDPLLKGTISGMRLNAPCWICTVGNLSVVIVFRLPRVWTRYAF